MRAPFMATIALLFVMTGCVTSQPVVEQKVEQVGSAECAVLFARLVEKAREALPDLRVIELMGEAKAKVLAAGEKEAEQVFVLASHGNANVVLILVDGGCVSGRAIVAASVLQTIIEAKLEKPGVAI
jgi:hypothetical protein